MRTPLRTTARGTALAIALALPIALTLGAAGAHACGAAKHAGASERSPGGVRAPLVIGDSVLLGGVPQAASAGYEVDARGCRQFGQALGMIAARRRAKKLPQLIVIALGTNGSIRMSQIREAMKLLGRGRKLGLVTPRELGGGSGSDARVVRAAGRRFPDRVIVLDWVRVSGGRRGWFAGDGIHLGQPGATGLARLLRGALAFAIAPLCP